MTSEELEQLRRSLVMAPGDRPATMLSNSVAASLINELLNLRRHGAAPVKQAAEHQRSD